jgi:hypothetical protein
MKKIPKVTLSNCRLAKNAALAGGTGANNEKLPIPEGFDPMKASDATLRYHGLHPRPDPKVYPLLMCIYLSRPCMGRSGSTMPSLIPSTKMSLEAEWAGCSASWNSERRHLRRV